MAHEYHKLMVWYKGKKITAYKRSALIAAEELCYSKDIIDKIWASNDDDAISRIMTNARLA